MKNLFKRYWDIIGGIFSGLGLSALFEWKLESIQLTNSIIILILLSIGFLRIIKETLEKRKNKRDHNIIDNIVDSQKPIKAIELAKNPTKQGEDIGKTFILTYREVLKGMKKVKGKVQTGWEKYKGYALTILSGLLTTIESHYGFINELCGGVLVIKGVEVLPIAFLILTIVVALLSNSFDNDEWKLILDTIKAFRQNKEDKKALNDEIQKISKGYRDEIKQSNKLLAIAKTELAKAEADLTDAQQSVEVKKQLYDAGVLYVGEYNAAKERLVETNNRVHKARLEIVNIEKHIKTLEEKEEKLKNQEV